MASPVPVDVVIFGGGVAGLWTLDVLSRAGCSTLLLEADDLGCGQTITSQGIIHGGLKYTLGGLLTPSARSISDMPVIWRRCLAGETKPDLSGTRLRASFCYLWRTATLKSKLAMIGARAGLRVAPVKINAAERPGILADCPGVVARLDEQVIEPVSFLADLSQQYTSRIIQIDAQNGLEFAFRSPGEIEMVRLLNPETGEPLDLRPGVVVFAAGSGNDGLRNMAGLDDRAMQRRPLHMVMVRGENDLPILNGHCVDGTTTRMTVTSTRDFADRTIWQIGGQIAEDGVPMNEPDLIDHAKTVCRQVLPRFEINRGWQWATYRVDRAEPATNGGRRPDDAFAARQGNTITAWPTKLALAPALAARIKTFIQPAKQSADDRQALAAVRRWPRPVVALAPWETREQWHSGD